jgi:dipeptidyl aminopeptidase/acylaminoacyl peptidase
LAFVVHGGPSWASHELLLDWEDVRYYPTVELVSRGVLVLEPNYRGSLGRGQAFLELNAGNLGVGDLWDLESAVDALVEQGLVDPERVVCMGWSQGGYISAMAATHSDRFKAVSVGAGISDWYTYRVSNDIPQFTDHYLGSSPFDDREIYRETAPIERLSGDTAPMLIQHGENDQRVPLSNAMELFRGLQDKGVPVELFVYPGMGHPITKPRENRAVMWQNLTWFAHHLFGDDLDFLRDTGGDSAAD